MASERLSGDERELLYAIAQQATALAGGAMNTEAHDERELLAEIELQLRTLVESGGGGTPGGSDTQIQYNNAGAFGGVAGMTYVPPDISIVGDAAAHGVTGSVTISSGESTDDADSGNITIQAADGGANGGAPGSFSMSAGDALFGDIDGGSLSISSGNASGAGTGRRISNGWWK